MSVLRRYYPKYKSLSIHESSPGNRGVSPKLARECRRYAYSHFFPGIPLGKKHPVRNELCESLEALTFASNSVDIFITQDVLEHVFDPVAAFREIARVLKPGGAHIFTVPLVRKTGPSERRAAKTDDGNVENLKEARFHGNPIDDSGSLVTMDWGYDISSFIYDASGLATHMITIDDIDRGINAEYIEVLASFKRA